MVLNGRIGYQIDADMLTLAHPNGSALVLRGGEPASPGGTGAVDGDALGGWPGER
jgi:hypothetical protein